MTSAERNGVRLAYDQARRRRLARSTVNRLIRSNADKARIRRLRSAIPTGCPTSHWAQLYGVLSMLEKTTSGRAATSVESCAALPTGGKAT